MNKHAAYIEETVEGGLSAYIANQNARYADAIKSGDVDLMTRLAADSARVGYILSPVASKPNESGVGQIPQSYLDSHGVQTQSAADAAAAVGDKIAGLFNKGSNMVTYLIVGFFALLVIKIID